MPILDAAGLLVARNQFDSLIHNAIHSVRMVIKTGVGIVHPGYENDTEPLWHTFNDFRCSVYEFASGGLTRFDRVRTRYEEYLKGLGILNDVVFLLEYVDKQYILNGGTGVCSNGLPGSNALLQDVTTDLSVVGTGATDLPVVRPTLQTLEHGTLVVNVTDGSQAYVTTIASHQLTTTGLTGGTHNLFQLNDAYRLYVINNLNVADQVLIHNKWRTVLATINDSEGIQVAVFLSD
ncbi:MAG: hypothetical protein WC998_00560 [Candidatus Paceibacterota bacterium]|jgi:hypothetical protein